MGPEPRQRRGLRALALGALALVALAAALALFLGMRSGRAPAAAPSVAAAPPAPPAPPPAPAAGPEEPLPEPIRRFLDATPYPSSSGRLTAAHEDLLHPNRRHERPRPIPDTVGHDAAGVVTTLLTSDRYWYTGDQTARASLRAWRGGAPFLLDVREARAEPEGRAGPTGEKVAVSFRPEDEALVAELPLGAFGDHHGPVLLTVRYAWEEGREEEEKLRLFVTPTSRIPARLTGEFEDDVRAGSLVVDVGVEVDAPGFYRFDANLHDADGKPVAFASFKGELERSDRSFPLEFYGKVLRDAGAAGPFTVAELRGYRFLDGQYPDRERLPDSDLTFTTREVSPTALTDEPFVSEHEKHMVTLMMDDLAAGRPLFVPEVPAPGEQPGPRPPDDDLEVGGPADAAAAPARR